MIKNIFFDFNGTLIDDVSLCLDLLNTLLKKQGHKEVDIIKYKEIFRFPIKDYYIDAGVTFFDESYEQIAVWFVNEYMKRYLAESRINDDVIDILNYLLNKGYNLYCLSASEKSNLISQLEYFKLDKYFKDILGISNIYAKSKIDIARDYIEDNGISKNSILFIGDTTHDYELSKLIGGKTILHTLGHQARPVLDKTGAKVISSFKELKEIL